MHQVQNAAPSDEYPADPAVEELRLRALELLTGAVQLETAGAGARLLLAAGAHSIAAEIIRGSCLSSWGEQPVNYPDQAVAMAVSLLRHIAHESTGAFPYNR